jgi:tripartite-type tricarboxylate transporter receptor subunit TctC
MPRPIRRSDSDIVLSSYPHAIIVDGHRNEVGECMKILSFVASLIVALAGLLTSLAATRADDYPSKPITIVVGFAPGGPTDTVARIIAQHISKTLGQSVIVENQTGAAGTIAMTHVVRSPPDGYTLSVGQWTTNVGAVMAYPVQFDVLKDFAPISLLTSSKLLIVARKDLPANTAKELVAWLKANPGKANGASVGVGSAVHVCLLDFMNRTGTKFQLVYYRGGAPAVQDLASGQADISCLEGGQTLGLYHGGKVKFIGVVSKSRWDGAPEIPTLAEGGVPGVEIEFWHGLWAPKDTPKPIIAKLNAAVVAAFDDPAVRKRFKEIGHTIPPRENLTPEKLYAHHKAEIEKWWPIMKAAGIKPQGS